MLYELRLLLVVHPYRQQVIIRFNLHFVFKIPTMQAKDWIRDTRLEAEILYLLGSHCILGL